MISRYFILLLLIVFAGSESQAQESINLGGVALRLGMKEEYVLSSLGENFDIDRPQAVGSPLSVGPSKHFRPITAKDAKWFGVFRREAPHFWEGTVVFSNGKLVAASRDWLVSNKKSTGIEMVEAIFGVVARITKSGPRDCRIDSEIRMAPGAEVKTTFIICGSWSVQILAIKAEGKPSETLVTEELRVPKTAE